MRRSTPAPSFGWPLILLFLGLGCLGLAVVEAVRNVRSNEKVATAALAGYSKFAAWSYEEHLREALRAATREVLGAVYHGNGVHQSPPIPDASELGHYLKWDVACACHRAVFGPLPREFFGFKLGTDTMGVGRNIAAERTAGWLVDPLTPSQRQEMHVPLLAEPQRRWLHDTISALAHGDPSDWGFRVLAIRMDDTARIFTTTVMPTSWGDTLVYVAEYGPEAVDAFMGGVLDDPGLLPAPVVRDHRNRQVLSVKVTDARGGQMFDHQVPGEWQPYATIHLPPEYGALTVQLGLTPKLAGQLVIGGLPRSRLPLLLILLALAAGLTVIALVQLRRESRFSRERAAFVASVSHELRTPLAQIRLVSDTLRLERESDPARRAAALALVDREVTRLQHLVENILRFTRGSRPDGTAPRETVDLAAEVRTVVEEFAPLASGAGAEVRCEASAGPDVALRPGALRQILLNLLDNAVKYGPRGQVITVRVESANGAARVSVADQGPGVPARERQRIWEAFGRGTLAGDLAVGGSGIGLTVVREIAESHGGRAAVTEAPGGGAMFVIEFPLGPA
jgi:signal transduction histidine kinase